MAKKKKSKKKTTERKNKKTNKEEDNKKNKNEEEKEMKRPEKEKELQREINLKAQKKHKKSSNKKEEKKLKKESKNKKEYEEPSEEINSEIDVEEVPKKVLNEDSQKDRKVLQEYSVKIDKAEVQITIESDSKGIRYKINMPKVKKGTAALLNDIRKEIVSVGNMGGTELSDQKSIDKIKERFSVQIQNMLKEKVPTLDNEKKEFLTGLLIQEMVGLGKLEFLINDPRLEEIVVLSSKEVVRVYHKTHGWIRTNLRIKSEDKINNYANIIARRVGRQINVLSPLLDAHVVTGDRANAVLYPISTKGNTITIRKFARDPWTIVDLIKNNTINLELASLIWLAIEYEMNILISGGTASGKTVILNAFMPFVPPNQRLISIEDTRELMLPEFLYWCPLVTRTANPEGKGEVSMLNLLVNSLRMRPDRIVLGEMRRQKEAQVLFEAMHTGHSVYATLHADSAAETISRLINPPLNVPPNLLKSVNLNVVMFRDRRKSIRRVLQVAEFETGKERVTSNLLYRWLADQDKIVKHNKSTVFMETLSRHTTMTQKEINKSMEKKREILNWLIKNNIRDLKRIGKVMNLYYTNKELLDKIIEKNQFKKLE